MRSRSALARSDRDRLEILPDARSEPLARRPGRAAAVASARSGRKRAQLARVREGARCSARRPDRRHPTRARGSPARVRRPIDDVVPAEGQSRGRAAGVRGGDRVGECIGEDGRALRWRGRRDARACWRRSSRGTCVPRARRAASRRRRRRAVRGRAARSPFGRTEQRPQSFHVRRNRVGEVVVRAEPEQGVGGLGTGGRRADSGAASALFASKARRERTLLLRPEPGEQQVSWILPSSAGVAVRRSTRPRPRRSPRPSR